MFELIKPIGAIKKPEVNKHELYVNAFYKSIKRYKTEQQRKANLKKLLVYGVKAVNSNRSRNSTTQEQVEQDFHFIEVVKMFMAMLTPREILNLYPIAKEYNGARWGVKDYYYTRDYLKGLDMDKPLEGDVLDFLWEYHNWELARFNVNAMSCLSDLMRMQGQPGIVEQFFEDSGVKTFTLHKDSDGKEFMVDNQTGKSCRVRKLKPRYVRAVK